MQAVTLKQDEAAPAAWPGMPGGLSDAAIGVPEALVWQRIEAWTAHRWTARDVTWIVEGPGEWQPPLAPATVSASSRWTGSAWEAVTLPEGPLGYALDAGTYRIEASVGGGTVPEPVKEAYRRLAAYLAETPDRAGAGRYQADAGQLSESFDRNPAWQARALHLSGAADLLRQFRRA